MFGYVLARVYTQNRMPQQNGPSEAAKNQVVEKDAFDAILGQLMASRPISKQAISRKLHSEGRRTGPKPGAKPPRRVKPSR